jgi:hypothetical protein
MGPSASNQRLITYAVTALVVLVIIAFRIMRSRTARPLNIDFLWVVPVLYLLLVGFIIFGFASTTGLSLGPVDLAIMAASLAAGSAVGWWRGKLMKIDVHPETHAVTVQASAWAIGVILILLVARLGIRYLFMQNLSSTSPQANTITVDFVLAAIGVLGVARLEMWTRARRKLEEARAAKAAA